MFEITNAYIEQAIADAEAGLREIPEVEGFSSDKIRRFLNALCALPDANYLEIGTHLGGLIIPALWNNPHTVATCIDNWSMFGYAHEEDFRANLEEFLPGRAVNVLHANMYTVDLALIPAGINIYFYDGPHDEKAQYTAFKRFDPVFAQRFVAMVDDWRWEAVRHGTERAFNELHYDIEADWVQPSRNQQDREQWWNRLYIAIINKGDQG